jgi:GNAT superfamily N-acetyltransferase
LATREAVTFSIRLATSVDVPLLPPIERSAGQIFKQIEGLEWIATDQVMSEELHQIAVDAGSAWVACDADGPIAFLSAERVEHALHINEISVHEQAMGQGIGRALMLRAVGFARGKGLDSITLTTFRTVPWNEAYYQRLGFITLATEELDERLAEILAAEADAGLPPELRCAMRLTLP